VPVLCEVDAGLAVKIEHERCWTLMRRAASFVRIWPLEPTIAQVFGDLFVELKMKGRVLSHVDLSLAALAKLQKLVLLTTDRDFEAMPDLARENWLDT
jgi:predicted nucleic acid-binding protein